MQRLFNLSMFVFLIIFLSGEQAKAQDKEDKKIAKSIVKVNKWQCDKLLKDGRELNVKSILGIVTMEFSIIKEKKNKKIVDAKGNEKTKKVLEVTNVFKMEMGGNDRIFNYHIINDSIKFVGLNGFNDFKVIRSEKDELVIEQILDKKLWRWTLIPAPKEKKKK
jgi:hypothetical protein